MTTDSTTSEPGIVDALGPRPRYGLGGRGNHRPGLNSVHRPGSVVLAELLAGIDQYRDVLDALRVLDPIDPPDGSVAAGNAAYQLAGEIQAGALSGELDPSAIAGRAYELLVAIQTRNMVDEALNAARRDLTDQLGDVVVTNLDSLLAALHARLTEVLNRCRALTKSGPLARLVDAGDAFDDGRGSEVETFRQLTAAYLDIRDAQVKLLRVADRSAVISEAKYLEDTLSVMPQWAGWREHGCVVQRKLGGRVNLTPPWPHTSRRQNFHATEDAPAFLAWIVDSGAKAWVPTIEQLDEAAAVLQGELSSPTDHGGDLVHPSLWKKPQPEGAEVGARG